MKKISLAFLGLLTSGIGCYAQNQVFHLNGGQSWGHVVTLATDNTGGPDDARLLLSYRNGSKRWAIGGQNNINRFSIWEDAGDGNYNYGGGYGNERFTVVPGGNVGIGTPGPNAKLEVKGTMLTGAGEGNIDGVNLSFLANSAQMLTGWNRTGGSGEADFIANQGAGGFGGFAFFNHDNNNAETQLMRIMGNGSVGIGTASPDPAYKLSVNGSIRGKEVKVEAGWSDYVFKKGYQLRPLHEVEAYIAKNSHLPDVPSEAEVKKNGVNLGETESLLLKKVEELTLYLIEKDKEVKSQQAGLKAQSDRNIKLEARLAKLEALLAKPVNKE